MTFPLLDHTYTFTDEAGTPVADVRIEDGGAKPLVRWAGTETWEVDREAVGMVLFADDLGLTRSD